MESLLLLIDSSRFDKDSHNHKWDRKQWGLFRGLFILGIGFYYGAYTSQNYEMPQLLDPQIVLLRTLQDFQDLMKQYEKKKGNVGGGDSGNDK